MSLDHTRTMLKTLKQYHTSEILVTYNGKDGTPTLTICFKDGCYELKSLITSVIETCDDIEDTITSIDRLMNVS